MLTRLEGSKSVECPKCRNAVLLDSQLPGEIPVKRCSECKGMWLSNKPYREWRHQQPQKSATPDLLQAKTDLGFTPSPVDSRAGLCPECSRYLSRAKVKYKQPFFLERCPECEGFWCDEGEWELLSTLGLNSSLEQFFDRQWQMQMREQEYVATERQTLIDKLGEEFASEIFSLSDRLLKHPNGDYGLAYLMRKTVNKMDVKEVQKFKDGQLYQ
ncbi:zf-TFIIB domain-containing protein [Spirulina sp. 06S082]|uniref:TFIIB-type zinc ribbon-containing protein n=1 Tax=Spirulina sp. 06S082 TaxID=3110248 RepID=UPI002B20611A|nr:zf-TFIIB domain-containing protein [Spirulina sp. 06S082]MEA5470929.1 zf-TFIIB domain-containing protein [Spirulina sp. 06S082]